jgi:hypothetical protein
MEVAHQFCDLGPLQLASSHRFSPIDPDEFPIPDPTISPKIEFDQIVFSRRMLPDEGEGAESIHL